MLGEHEGYELQEQFLAEQYWPVGEAAENLRAEMIGHMVANAMAFDQKRADRIKTIWEMLSGQYDPDAAKTKGVTKGQLKAVFGRMG